MSNSKKDNNDIKKLISVLMECEAAANKIQSYEADISNVKKERNEAQKTNIENEKKFIEENEKEIQSERIKCENEKNKLKNVQQSLNNQIENLKGTITSLKEQLNKDQEKLDFIAREAIIKIKQDLSDTASFSKAIKSKSLDTQKDFVFREIIPNIKPDELTVFALEDIQKIIQNSLTIANAQFSVVKVDYTSEEQLLAQAKAILAMIQVNSKYAAKYFFKSKALANSHNKKAADQVQSVYDKTFTEVYAKTHNKSTALQAAQVALQNKTNIIINDYIASKAMSAYNKAYNETYIITNDKEQAKSVAHIAYVKSQDEVRYTVDKANDTIIHHVKPIAAEATAAQAAAEAGRKARRVAIAAKATRAEAGARSKRAAKAAAKAAKAKAIPQAIARAQAVYTNLLTSQNKNTYDRLEQEINILKWLQSRWTLDKIFNTKTIYKTQFWTLTKSIKTESQNIKEKELELKKIQGQREDYLNKLPGKVSEIERKLKEKIQHIQDKVCLYTEIERTNLKTKNSKITERISALEQCIKSEREEIFLKSTAIKKEFSDHSKLISAAFSDNAVSSYNNVVCLGQLSIPVQNNKTTLPCLVPFPIQRAVSFEGDKNSIIFIILKMLNSVPLKQLSISVIDPLELGNSLGDLKLLLPYKQLFPAGRVLTRANEIENELDQHVRYVENLNQAVFNTSCNEWDSYNKQNPQRQLPYKLLIIYDFPESFSDRSISYLSKLLRHGPKCGILPLIVCNIDKLSQERRFESFLPEFKKYCCNLADLFKFSNNLELKSLQLTEERDCSLTPQEYQSIITRISEKLSMISKNDTLTKPVNTDLWGGNATECISASIGRNAKDNSDTLLAFGDAPNTIHALLGGKTGSGKSNLLHVLINSLCFKYSPEEFQLYLLDYKDGIEFNFYANPVLPHARLVATQSDVEYGFTVLRHLEEERSRRMEMFKDVSVADYKSYRKKTGNKLPRILVIIDEFQRLFECDSRSANEIKELLTSLLRLSRAAGIHFLLATQSIRGGLQHMTFVGMLNHLTGRIALSCTQEDSAAILSIGNDAAAELQSPPEAILNNSNGMKSANIRFSVPFAEPEYRQNLLEQLNLCAKKENLELQNTVFQGDILPKVPNLAEFRTACDKLGLSLLLGKKHHFLGENFCTNISRGNLLIAGYNWNLRRGLLHSIFYSLKSLPQKPAILYLNSDEEMILSPSAKIEGPNFVYKDGSWNGSDLNDFIAKDGEKIIIIDSFDYARAFHSKGTTMSLPFGRTQGPPSPFELLCDIADPISSIQDVHILLFVEDYERFSSSAKQLLGHFDLRIGFGMDEDQAGRFIKPGSGAKKFPGIENSQKAVFVDCKRNKQFLIRPFILPE